MHFSVCEINGVRVIQRKGKKRTKLYRVYRSFDIKGEVNGVNELRVFFFFYWRCVSSSIKISLSGRDDLRNLVRAI